MVHIDSKRIRNTNDDGHLTTLFRDTNGLSATTRRLGVLTPNTESPVVSETTVSTDLLQTFKVVTELGVNTVGKDLVVLSVNNIPLPVKEPCWNLELRRVLDDSNNSLKLIRVEFSSPDHKCQRMRLKESHNITHRLLRSTSAFLQTMLAYRRPTPLISVKAYMILRFPSTLVLSRRRMCYGGNSISGSTA